MRMGIAVALLSITAALSWGCSKAFETATSSSNLPQPPSTPTTNTHFVYTANASLGSVHVYSMDHTTGELTFMGTSSTESGSVPKAVAVNPANTFLYSANYATDKISIFSIDQSQGTLTNVSHTAVYDKPVALSFNAAGTFLFVAFEGAKRFVTYSVNPATGALTEDSSLSTGTDTPTDFVVHPDGDFGIGAMASLFQGYDIDVAGALSAAGTDIAVPMNKIAVAPNGLFMAGAGGAANEIYTYDVDPSAGTPISGEQINSTSGTLPSLAVAIDPTSQFVYSANTFDDAIEAFTINAGTGVLTSQGDVTLASGCTPRSLAIDPDGGYLYTACSNSSGTIVIYSIDPTTGALTLVDSATYPSSGIQGLATLKF